MTRRLLMTATALTVSLSAFADDGWLTEALEAELTRNVAELTLPEAPPLYHLRYKALQLDQVDVGTSLGSVVRFSEHPYNALFVEARVGSPAFDNTGFGGWQTGFRSGPLPIEPTARSVQAVAWRVTDRSYKEAVEQYARKDAQFTPPDDYPGDYTLTGAVVGDNGTAAIGDAAFLRDLAKALSAATAEQLTSSASSAPGEVTGVITVERGDAYVGHEAGALTIVDTEGTRLIMPVEECTLRVAVHVRADDGMLLTDHRLWTVRQPSDLPPEKEMVAEARQMTRDLLLLARAEPFADEYVGPVIFAEDAAVDLFRYVLMSQLQGTPPEIPFDSFFGDLGGDDQDAVRLHRRVLPLGWTVEDDPRALPSHPASFVHDVEGTPSQAVTLVEDGIVRTLLMSRVPRKDLAETNGHARGLGVRPMGRATIMEITPPRHESDAKLRKKAFRIASSYDRDWIVVVKRLQEPAVRNLTGGHSYGMMGDGPSLPMPVSIVRRYADGREEDLRGAAFAGVQRFVLRDIVATGAAVSADFMASHRGEAWGWGPTEGMPTRLTAPEVLIGEMELVPTPGDPKSVPLIPAPDLTGGP